MPPDAPHRLHEIAMRIGRLGLAGRWDPESAYAEREALVAEVKALADSLEASRPIEYRSAFPTPLHDRCRRLEALVAHQSAKARKLAHLLASARPRTRRRLQPMPGQLSLPLEV